MRTRPLTVLTAIAAVTLVIAGCDEALVEARVGAKVPAKVAATKAGFSTPGRDVLGPQPQLIPDGVVQFSNGQAGHDRALGGTTAMLS